MAYISAAEVKVIRNNLKKEFPQFKFSVTGHNHSSVTVAIMAGPVRFSDKDHASLNHYYPENYENADILKKIIAIVNEKNFDKSDIMSDYFHVGFYLHIEQGKWDKPFVLTSAV